MSERKFEELSVEEQHNEILKTIHNCLSEISTSLEYLVCYSSFVEIDDLDEFQRKWTSCIERCKCLYINKKREETQEGESN